MARKKRALKPPRRGHPTTIKDDGFIRLVRYSSGWYEILIPAENYWHAFAPNEQARAEMEYDYLKGIGGLR